MKLLYLFSLSIFFKILFFSNYVFCASHSKEEWKSRSIYQILTDRFALTNDNDKILFIVEVLFKVLKNI